MEGVEESEVPPETGQRPGGTIPGILYAKASRQRVSAARVSTTARECPLDLKSSDSPLKALIG